LFVFIVMLKRGFYGHTANYHHILHRRHAGGLLDVLANSEHSHQIDSLDTKDYFERYLREPEGLERLTAAVKTICTYEFPETDITVNHTVVKYGEGVNRFATMHARDNVNYVVIVFEEFPQEGAGISKLLQLSRATEGPHTRGGATNNGGANGHFMLLWRFVKGFDRREDSKGKFCLFDPFGRLRPNDPEVAYYQKAPCFDYQWPESNTCALWCIFALLQFALQKSRFSGISPVEYDGMEDKLTDDVSFLLVHKKQWMENERILYSFLVNHYFIFQPRVPSKRSLI